MARNDLNRDPWISPAGFVNGQIANLVRLAFNPNQLERDQLYKNSVNPVISQPGKGTVLFGDKTFTTKNTSLNRLNVRRLFIELQRTISGSADNVLFDRNDATTRSNFVNLITPYLRSVQARRGITAFRVVCDITNNPESVTNANEFICDIFVQPIRSVNFIQLNFVSVSGTATFNEIAG
jgi:phage tail sheath protein FI